MTHPSANPAAAQRPNFHQVAAENAKARTTIELRIRRSAPPSKTSDASGLAADLGELSIQGLNLRLRRRSYFVSRLTVRISSIRPAAVPSKSPTTLIHEVCSHRSRADPRSHPATVPAGSIN